MGVWAFDTPRLKDDLSIIMTTLSHRFCETPDASTEEIGHFPFNTAVFSALVIPKFKLEYC